MAVVGVVGVVVGGGGGGGEQLLYMDFPRTHAWSQIGFGLKRLTG